MLFTKRSGLDPNSATCARRGRSLLGLTVQATGRKLPWPSARHGLWHSELLLLLQLHGCRWVPGGVAQPPRCPRRGSSCGHGQAVACPVELLGRRARVLAVQKLACGGDCSGAPWGTCLLVAGPEALRPWPFCSSLWPSEQRPLCWFLVLSSHENDPYPILFLKKTNQRPSWSVDEVCQCSSD